MRTTRSPLARVVPRALPVAALAASLLLGGCSGCSGQSAKSVVLDGGDGSHVTVAVDRKWGYDVTGGEAGTFSIRDKEGNEVVSGIVTGVEDFEAYKRQADDGTLGDQVTENGDDAVAWTYLGGDSGAERNRIVRVSDKHAVLMGSLADEQGATSAYEAISVSAE